MEKIRKNSWAAFRDIVLAKELVWQYDESTLLYHIFAVDTGIVYEYRMKKDAVPGADQIDWQDNYKAMANGAIPQKRSTFSVGEYRFRGSGENGTCAAGSASTIDYTMTEKRLLSGGGIVVTGSQIFDWIKFQVVTADGTTVIDEYVEKWYINPASGSGGISMEYAGTIQKDWILRLTYTADAAGGERKIGVNYYLHKPV